ncbi:MAG: 1-acyl-sn-glycerol-3-phosphate acyltransferase [Actinobacteria bacterium]|nr:1-acyl-sn-glycerol-3-phosphate acyltransferase [Actinomycetota bacterium]MBU1945136.1 1-acyl-sn-glycerol-3-phosphate acyltransferase [Actinomycetota bacterium]MBU2686413.1 1-acyl-sn-glycerol-3-phosphate acyltransferase [Actinomycetota bacterium]
MSVYRLKWSGAENAPVSGPFIIVSNHQTSVDGLGIAIAIKKVARHHQILPWAKVEIRKGQDGIIGAILWRIFAKVEIDRGASDETPKAIKKSLDCLKKRKIVLVFPEGTRYTRGEVGPFRYGVANLARAVPAPVLPVGVYRRAEDNGVQVNIGQPFFMPALPQDAEVPSIPRNRAEAMIVKQLELARQWGEEVGRDRRGMKLLAAMIGQMTRTLERYQSDFNRLVHMATPEDNELMRDRVMELLPDDWRKVETPSHRDRPDKQKLFPE